MVCVDAGMEVSKDSHLIRLRHRRLENVQVLVEFVPALVRAGHRRGVEADGCGELASPEMQAEAHQIVDALRQTGQSSNNVVPDGKGDAPSPSLCPGATAPEEGLAGIHLLQLALFGEPGLAECGGVLLVARKFTSQ
nr:unnamed protein product [Spirometra erinaceieuropaei]